MTRCLIVDDEPLARQVLEGFIARMPSLEVVGVAANAMEAFEMVGTGRVDLMFLDIKMPRLSGLDFLRSLKSAPAVVFTTAYGEHAVAGFELEAVDYLLKPISFERFERSIGRFMKTRHHLPADQKDYTYFKVSGELVKVLHDELVYAQSVKDYIQLHTRSGKYLTHMTMKYLSGLLPGSRFLRVHRSYLVNRSCVDQVDRTSLKVQGKIIPIGENYRHILSGVHW